MRKKLNSNAIFGLVEGCLKGIEYFGKDVFSRLRGVNITVIIPAYNEASSIRKVAEAVKGSRADEIIVVDDGSTDRTYERVKGMDIKVIKHEKNMGKGAAMKTGLKNARGRIIAFIDADLRNLTPQKVNMLIDPIIKNEADFVKSYFSYYKSKTGTSRFLYRPLLRQLFSSESGFTHPVSGQVAGRKSFFDRIEFRNDYGVDISILIDAVKNNLRIKEVCIGKLVHRKRSLYQIERISDNIIKAMLEKAGFKGKEQ